MFRRVAAMGVICSPHMLKVLQDRVDSPGTIRSSRIHILRLTVHSIKLLANILIYLQPTWLEYHCSPSRIKCDYPAAPRGAPLTGFPSWA